MAAGNLVLQAPKNLAPRIIPGGDGRQEFEAAMQWDGASTQSFMDCPFKYLTGCQITPTGGIPDDMSLVDAMVDGKVARDTNGKIQIKRTDTTSSGNFFIRLTGIQG